MAERTLRGEVVYAIDAEEQDEYDLREELQSLATSRRILVVRDGGRPSRVGRLLALLRRTPIEAVTLVTDATAEEGDVVRAEVRETDLANVFVADGDVRVE